ncbi:helix-turn-helix domain-containing protein [Sporosarcina sp. NPDC096371]
MIIKKAYKLCVHPYKDQQVRIAKTIGCSPFVFDYFLDK